MRAGALHEDLKQRGLARGGQTQNADTFHGGYRGWDRTRQRPPERRSRGRTDEHGNLGGQPVRVNAGAGGGARAAVKRSAGERGDAGR